MLVKVRNLGNSFRTITAGELKTGETVMLQPWEVKMWLKYPGISIEVVEENQVAEPSEVVEEVVEEPKPKRKKNDRFSC